MKRRKALHKKIIVITTFLFLLFFILFLSFLKNIKNEETKINQTNKENITTPFQENISIEVPEGVKRIEKGGRIKIVE
ncbi:MAG: hypothetical protein QXL14_03620 [Candidatus Aenigmatarchaeota archaeon]